MNGYGDRVVLENAKDMTNSACLEVGESPIEDQTKPDTSEMSEETRT